MYSWIVLTEMNINKLKVQRKTPSQLRPHQGPGRPPMDHAAEIYGLDGADLQHCGPEEEAVVRWPKFRPSCWMFQKDGEKLEKDGLPKDFNFNTFVFSFQNKTTQHHFCSKELFPG